MNRRDFLKRTSMAAAAVYVERFVSAPLAAAQTSPALPAILTRKIPSTGEAIPAVGLGTWNAFMPRDPNDENTLRSLGTVLKAFFDTGGRVVDTAPAYGSAEEVTGKLSERLGINRDLFFATKISANGKDNAVKMLESSFKKLRREKIELIQVHNLADWQNNLAILRDWKQQGRFKYIGVTHIQPTRMGELERIAQTEKIDAIQLPYSVAMREADERLIPACRQHGVAVLVMRPFEAGNLFGKTRDKPLPDSIKPWASSWAEAFLKWILANDTVTIILPATSKIDHLNDNMKAGFGRLPDEKERKELIAVLGA